MPRTTHDRIVLERRFDAPAARLFAAWAETRALERWCCPGDDGWSGSVEAHEFRPGGIKRIRFGPPGEPPCVEESRYVDIVPDVRIVNTEIIRRGEQRISASIITLEFEAEGTGAVLSVVDQITLIDAADSPEARRGGWGEVLTKLAAEVSRADAR